MQQDMQNNTNNDELSRIMRNRQGATEPVDTTSAFYTESFSEVLVQAIGYHAVCEFLIGTSGLEIKEGIIYAAGANFLTLRDPDTNRYTICDIYSLKFATIYDVKGRPVDRVNVPVNTPVSGTNPLGAGVSGGPAYDPNAANYAVRQNSR
nr:hypothetical protein [Maliibacterium massiliense]